MRTTLSHLSFFAALAQQAPDDNGAASASTRKRQAKHELLDATGTVTENEPEATGIRYTLLGLPDKPFSWQSGLEPGKATTMLAVFGAKTLATNESSAARNSDKGEASAEEQMDAVVQRFALLETGEWVDRTGGPGAKINLDALAEAIFQTLESEGKIPAERQGKPITPDDYRAVLREAVENPVYARKARTNAKTAANYATIVGRSQASVDDLAV